MCIYIHGQLQWLNYTAFDFKELGRSRKGAQLYTSIYQTQRPGDSSKSPIALTTSIRLFKFAHVTTK